jgi:prophage maintenance system killer protein
MTTDTAADRVSYLALDDYLGVVQAIRGGTKQSVERQSRLDLVDAALNAPAAFVRGSEIFPRLSQKAAVLCARLAVCAALPPPNFGIAFRCMCLFLDRNGQQFEFPAGADEARREIDLVETLALMERLEAGAAREREVEAWVRSHTRGGPA